MPRWKFSLLIVVGVFDWTGVASAVQDDEPKSHSIAELAWLTGSWSGEQGPARTEEHWLEPAGGMMLATNRTVNGDKGSFEFLRIQQRGNSIVYFASPAGRPAIEFALTEIFGQRVVFENPRNDFPQRIIYERNADRLNVTIESDLEGQTRRVQWTWDRKK